MQLIAHRGESASFPENTMAAFDAALESADGLELDLTLTRDGHVVVMHDETLERTTNGTGRITERSWSEVCTLDAGGWFAERFEGESIPQLGQVLDRYRDRLLINLELKPEAFGVAPGGKGLLDRVLEQVADRPGGLLLSSFEWRFLEQCRKRAPRLPLGVLLHEGPLQPAIDFAKSIDAASLHLERGLVDAEAVDRVHAAQRRLLVYTVDEPTDLSRLQELGVDGVFTNRSRSLRPLVASFS